MQLIGHFGARVYSTLIPRNVRLAEAPSHGKPALLYDAGSRGAIAYLAAASEMLRRHGRSPVAPIPAPSSTAAD
jgi:chromosome partitioning protein